MLRDLLRLHEKVFGLAHHGTLHALTLYAGVLWHLGRAAEAQRSLEVLVEAQQQMLQQVEAAELASSTGITEGSSALTTGSHGEVARLARVKLADSLGELCTVLLETEQVEAAIDPLRRLLPLYTLLHGGASEQAMSCRAQLARALAELSCAKREEAGDVESEKKRGAEAVTAGKEAAEAGAEAVSLFRWVVEAKVRESGHMSQEVADLTSELSVLLQEVSRPEEAETQARCALSIYVHLFGEEHSFTATCLSNLALLLFAQAHHA